MFENLYRKNWIANFAPKQKSHKQINRKIIFGQKFCHKKCPRLTTAKAEIQRLFFLKILLLDLKMFFLVFRRQLFYIISTDKKNQCSDADPRVRKIRFRNRKEHLANSDPRVRKVRFRNRKEHLANSDPPDRKEHLANSDPRVCKIRFRNRKEHLANSDLEFTYSTS